MPGKAVSADVEMTKSYPEDLAKIINAGGYNKPQFFSVDEKALYWQKIPSRTLIEEFSALLPSFTKGQADPIVMANTAGDFRLNPMLMNHSENPGDFTTLRLLLNPLCLCPIGTTRPG